MVRSVLAETSKEELRALREYTLSLCPAKDLIALSALISQSLRVLSLLPEAMREDVMGVSPQIVPWCPLKVLINVPEL